MHDEAYCSNELAGQVALVTGATRGIGRAIALALGKQGAQVIGTATREEGVQVIERSFDEQQIAGCGLLLNIGSMASIESALASIAERFAMPSIVVNNAGITVDRLFLRMQEPDWQQVLDINLTGAYRLISACLKPMLKARFGRIISIGSVVGSTGNPGQANYAAAKAGLIGLTKSLARELGSRGITVNMVSPGFIDTDMTRGLTPEQQEKIYEQIPLGRIGDVQDVAHAVSFLASSRANYITGENLHVNGGMYMCS